MHRVIYTLVYSAFLLSSAPLFSSPLVSIGRPHAGSTVDAEVVVAGNVELSTIERLRLSVEPFLATAGRQSFSRSLLVKNRRFREKVTLAPGLNIIRISTLGGKHQAARVLYLISERDASRRSLQDWGSASPVVFSSLNDLKVNTRRIELTGEVSDPAVKALDVVLLDTFDFFCASANEEKNIAYHQVAVKKGRFKFALKLERGLNIILAKPSGISAGEEDVRVKSVIYEAVSGRVTLDEPFVREGALVVTGQVLDAGVGTVDISVDCLVEQELRPGKIVPKTIIKRRLEVADDGSFRLEAQFRMERYTIKSPPSITVGAGGAVATKTLVNWR